MTSDFIHEIQDVIRQGGVVLWVMLVLSIAIYTLICSTFSILYKVKKELPKAKERITELTDLALISDELSMFELSHLAWIRRRIPVLSVLLALAPLSGLFGTVTGMLNTFAGLASASTTKPIDSISSGISEALITTQVGLIIAIPGLFLFHYLKGQITKVSDTLLQNASQHKIQLGSPSS